MGRTEMWMEKFQSLFNTCQGEIKKTTDIGKSMLNASKTNANLNHAYETLGQLVAEALRKEQLQWEHPKVQDLLRVITQCEEALVQYEDELKNIKGFKSFRDDQCYEKKTSQESPSSSEEKPVD